MSYYKRSYLLFCIHGRSVSLESYIGLKFNPDFCWLIMNNLVNMIHDLDKPHSVIDDIAETEMLLNSIQN